MSSSQRSNEIVRYIMLTFTVNFGLVNQSFVLTLINMGDTRRKAYDAAFKLKAIRFSAQEEEEGDN